MPLSVYVHIPFCSRRCDYCDFATWVDKNDLVEEYVNAITRQFHFSINQYMGNTSEPLTSIFFGGGTPNLIDAKYIAEIIETISKHVTISESTEITVESNPDHVTLEKLITYKSAGVNRISMGVQSTQAHVLEFIGREHDRDQVLNAREMISKSGIDNVSADLIYGAANETLQDWNATIVDALNLELDHISAYALGIEPGTPLGLSVSTGEKQNVDEDDLADKYELADETFSSNGFNWYEISNWAQGKKQSKHNLVYWRGGDVIALGCAAHGYTDSKRWSTPRNIDVYLDRFSPKRNFEELNSELFLDRDLVSSISHVEEEFALKLRTREGVKWPSKESTQILSEMLESDFVNFDPQTQIVSLTLKGRLLAHRISVELFEEYEQKLAM